MGESNLNIEELLLKFGAERRTEYSLHPLKAALNEAGSPEKNVKSIVIAGTNGKGTVTLLTTEALVAAGMKTATYMSPHLESVCERFQVNGQPIKEAGLSRLGNSHLASAQKHGLSYFEFLTLLFFLWAKEIAADVLVLEVGLGGRLDATNVTTPIACAITSIDYDHMNVLGNSLEEILLEKIAVVPDHGVLISGITQTALQEKAMSWCKNGKARYIPRAKAIEATANINWTGQEVRLGDLAFTIANPNPRWIDNANTAYTLVKTAFPNISDETIVKAFAKARFPGRFERIRTSPLVILSGDHNPAGTQSLLDTIALLPKVPIHTLCAFSLDKPYEAMFAKLKLISSSITLTTFPKQGDLPPSYRELCAEFIEDPRDAVQAVMKKAEANGLCLITGSLYLVGTLRAHLKNQ